MTRGPDVSTYDDDFFAWTQEQAAALRRLPRHVVGSTVDIEHLAEEIEDSGKRDLREVGSFLTRLFEHMMKIATLPASSSAAHWRGECYRFQQGASEAFSPSMRPLIDLSVLWSKARTRQIAGLGATLVAPSNCPFSLDELLSNDFDPERVLLELGTIHDVPDA